MVEQFTDQALDRSSKMPLYEQVAECLTRAVAHWRASGVDRLPSEPTLASWFGVSIPTVHQGVQRLVDGGVLVRRRGVGTLIVHAPPVPAAGRTVPVPT